MTRNRIPPKAARATRARTAALILSETELELLEVEMRPSSECGAEDAEFVAIHEKTLAALQQLRAIESSERAMAMPLQKAKRVSPFVISVLIGSLMIVGLAAADWYMVREWPLWPVGSDAR